MINNKVIISLIVIVLVAVVGFFGFSKSSNDEPEMNDKIKAIVYKSPNCGCCVSHVAYLKKHGYDVEVNAVGDIASVKEEHNIPYDKQSCHTTVVGDYFIEGHVPIEAFDKLLSEKPDIEGIGLPGMPAGSPGMPGVKSEDFLIYSLSNNNIEDFMKI
jgi:hypothetical protein